MDTLDQAALRRFDFKIHFDFMAPGQRETLFRDCMATLGIQVDVESLGVVAGLSRLTPGDYANVMRQAHLDPIPSGVVFAERLVLECNLKPGGPRAQHRLSRRPSMSLSQVINSTRRLGPVFAFQGRSYGFQGEKPEAATPPEKKLQKMVSLLRACSRTHIENRFRVSPERSLTLQ